jgi:hypothetical protein
MGRQGDKETRRQGDKETRQGDKARGQGDKGTKGTRGTRGDLSFDIVHLTFVSGRGEFLQ